jgi:HMG-box domain
MQRASSSEARSNEEARRSDKDSPVPDSCDLPSLETAMTSGFLNAENGLKTDPGARSMDKSDPNEVKVSASKPTKNLSAYNFYFKDQRRKMLEKLPIRPEGKPRRSHGKIGFSEMAKTIAAGWKSIDAETRSQYEYLAKQDKARYVRELEEWKGRHQFLDEGKLSRYLHSKGVADSSRSPIEGNDDAELRPDVYGSAGGVFMGASTGIPLTTGTIDSLHSNVQLLHATLHTKSQNAIEQLARPLRAAASLPNMQQFTSLQPTPLDNLPAISSLPSFRATTSPERFTSNQVPTQNALHAQSLSSWGTAFEGIPGGLSLLRQPAETPDPLNRYLVQRHPPPHPFPPPDSEQHAQDMPYPTRNASGRGAPEFPFLNASTPGISILANELDNEGVDFFLNLFRGSNPDNHKA